VTDEERALATTVLRRLPDEDVKRPLWLWRPEMVPFVLTERRRRFGVPTRDDFAPEYH
jgi:hypothetical protein